MRKFISTPAAIIGLLLIQFVPLVIFPAAQFSSKTQEWWLPVLLAFLAAIAVFQIAVRRSPSASPWYLLAFSHGFNIISRLMMLLPKFTVFEEKVQVFNTAYVVITIGAMLVSAFFLWYLEQPDVRLTLIKKQTA